MKWGLHDATPFWVFFAGFSLGGLAAGLVILWILWRYF